jgi:hypothetical protein
MFAELKRYRDQYGHCKVPQRWVENRRLSSWVTTQRNRKKKGTISPEQERRLDATGFIWEVHGTYWETMFAELKRYRDQYGHCKVPQRWVENPQLAAWVSDQRSRRQELTPEHEARLTGLGFAWDVPHREALAWRFQLTQSKWQTKVSV